MTQVITTPIQKESPLLFESLTWREFKEDAVLQVYHLRTEEDMLRYEKISSSEELQGIDLELLVRCIGMANHVEAVKTFQQSLQK